MKPARSFYNILIPTLIMTVIILVLLNVFTPANKIDFNELYFTGDLPKIVRLNEESKFSFAIHNLGNSKMTYDYEVYLQSGKINEGNLALDPDGTAVITPVFVIKDKTDNVSISVRLLDKSQEIHFWVDLE